MHNMVKIKSTKGFAVPYSLDFPATQELPTLPDVIKKDLSLLLIISNLIQTNQHQKALEIVTQLRALVVNFQQPPEQAIDYAAGFNQVVAPLRTAKENTRE